jgi:hypothetical protein
MPVGCDGPSGTESAGPRGSPARAEACPGIKEPLINSAAHLAVPFPPCISCRFFEERGGVVKLEILSIIGWVAIWEATSIAIINRPELVALRKSYERIIDAQIEIDCETEE